MPRRQALAGLGALMAGAAMTPLRAAGAAPVVAAASDLQFALPEIARDFTDETGDSVRLVFGSSGNFARQIRAGAPYELFLSADEAYALSLARAGLTQGEGALYALGRIALVAPTGGALPVDPGLEGLAERLGAGALGRFAIANPAHAPYGARAREALLTRGLWARIEPHLVLGENVAQAAQFALSGNADGGIVAWSLALAPPIAARARRALLPAKWHSPLRQRMVLMTNAGPVAQTFAAWLQAPRARAVLARYGFSLPDEG